MWSGGAEFRTAGLDLASQDNRTAMAEIRWGAGGAVIASVRLGVGNDAIVEAAERVAMVGVDCPLGWPTPFVDLLIAARANEVPPDAAQDNAAKQALVFRRTDVVVHELTGRWPLSVAADRIAYPAMRCAGLLARLREAGHPVRRSGIASLVAEVYPAAALRPTGPGGSPWSPPLWPAHRGWTGRCSRRRAPRITTSWTPWSARWWPVPSYWVGPPCRVRTRHPWPTRRAGFTYRTATSSPIRFEAADRGST
jgi:Protein of unknown function (DUF429)